MNYNIDSHLTLLIGSKQMTQTLFILNFKRILDSPKIKNLIKMCEGCADTAWGRY
jgi:hypothetical protein